MLILCRVVTNQSISIDDSLHLDCKPQSTWNKSENRIPYLVAKCTLTYGIQGPVYQVD